MISRVVDPPAGTKMKEFRDPLKFEGYFKNSEVLKDQNV